MKPIIIMARETSFFERSQHYMALKIYNKLPHNLKHKTSFANQLVHQIKE